MNLVMQIPPTAISIPWNRAVVEEWLPDDGGWGQVQRRGSNRALMGWRLFLLRPGAGGLSWAYGPGSLRWRGPPRRPRMWQRRWSRANSSVVSPWGRGSSTRGMKGRSSRGGAHSSTALSGSRDRQAATAVVAGTAAAAAVGAEVGGAAATAGPGLELSARGGEERRTLGLKVCLPWVFTMVGQEKERRWITELQSRKVISAQKVLF